MTAFRVDQWVQAHDGRTGWYDAKIVGVRGEVRVKSYCAVPEDIEDYRPLSTEDGSRTFTLALLHPVKNGFAACIAEFTAPSTEFTAVHRATEPTARTIQSKLSTVFSVFIHTLLS